MLLKDLYVAIGEILNGQTTRQSFHHISATCHQIMLRPDGLGKDVHAKIEETMEMVINGMVRECRGMVMSREAGWMKHLVARWQTWESKSVCRDRAL